MIQSIRLQNFRSYRDESFEFEPGVNIIVGPNTSGKTNLLEALMMLALGSSYRGAACEMIGFNKPWSRLDGHTPDGQRTVKLEVQGGLVKKSFEINGVVFSRLSQQKSIPTVLFEPQHLQLLVGRPELRRDYLDNLLGQTVSGYSGLARSYRRALLQRNNLLKKGPQTKSQLFAWDIRLSELGGQIAGFRHELVTGQNKQITKLYQKLSNSRAKVELHYISSCLSQNYSSKLLHKLETSTEQDYARGFTTYGPHRDDLGVIINGHNAQEMASRGEARTVVLALKILELKSLQVARDQKPLLLLDDVFSELDGARRRALTGFLEDYQTFITTTDADVVAHNFAQKCNIIPVSK